jgi:hypothetical protein
MSEHNMHSIIVTGNAPDSCDVLASGNKTNYSATQAFPLGDVYVTKAVFNDIAASHITWMLNRHCRGDWGDIHPEDMEANDKALVDGSRLLSAYMVADKKVWVVTEADRTVTIVLFPAEY